MALSRVSSVREISVDLGDRDGSVKVFYARLYIGDKWRHSVLPVRDDAILAATNSALGTPSERLLSESIPLLKKGG
jgi:hypothetical protein